MNRRFWFAFFLVSGFCSLLCEVVWLRLAMAAFGVTTALTSIVLSVFMAGLALGSWGAGVVARRAAGKNAAFDLRLYGLAEGAIGASAFVVPALLQKGHEALASAGRAPPPGDRPRTMPRPSPGSCSRWFPSASAWAPPSRSAWPCFARPAPPAAGISATST